MFLIVSLIFSCITSMHADVQKKDFVYHAGYSNLSKQYVNKLSILDSRFDSFCNCALLHDERDQIHGKIDCDTAVESIFAMYTSPHDMISGAHTLAYLIARDIVDPVEKKKTMVELANKFYNFVEQDKVEHQDVQNSLDASVDVLSETVEAK